MWFHQQFDEVGVDINFGFTVANIQGLCFSVGFSGCICKRSISFSSWTVDS